MKEKEEQINFKYNKYNRYTFKRRDSKQTKVTLLIKDYFNNHNSLTRDKFDEFLIFIDLKSIWKTENEQDILWGSISSYSKNKIAIGYDAAFKGIMELFKSDDEENNNKTNKNYSMEEINETFDKYLKSLNGNQEYLYDIQFINYIFLDKDEINLNSNNIENIINDIKSKYKFISINIKDIKNYFNCFNCNINKDIINNINTLIENNISEINKNNNGINNDHSNNNSRSISSASDNIINANSFSLSQGELFDKLVALDKVIFDCMESLIYFYKNKNLINLTKKYIQNYLLISKNNIYNNLKLIIENDNKMRNSDLKNSFHNEENNINNINNTNNNNVNSNNNTNNILNNLDLTKTEKPKSKYLSKREITYVKKNLTEKTYNNILNNNKKKNMSNNIINDNIDIDDDNYNNKIESKNNNINKNDEDLKKLKNQKNANHSRNKSDTHEKLVSLNFNKKLKKNISYCNLKLSQIKESNLLNIDNNKSHFSRNNHFTEKKEFHTQRDDESPFLEGSIEDLKMFTFSDNINDQYLVQTANIDNLENLDDNIEKGTPTLNPLEALDDLEYYEDFFKDNKIDIKNNNENDDNDIDFDNEQNININKEKHNLSNNSNNINNFTFGKAENLENENINIKLSAHIDSNLINYTKKKKYMNIGHYDFRYLYKDNNIKKLFNINKEKINPMKFLTDEVYIIPNNYLKKQKAILVMSSTFFYLLKATSTMSCISKLEIKSLKSISISSRNCNLILFVFENSVDIIIETLRRIEILKFIKEIKEKKIKINISHNFAPKKKTGDSDTINLKKTKIIRGTPNFENAQKVGILSKYQENFFINKFHERLVVLCDLGLMYFEENEKSPKVLIPIIGTTIKFVYYQAERLYCFQLKTINDESYIFGSKIKKETLDWIQEFSIFKTNYFLKLKEIEPNLMIHVRSKNHKQKGYK